MSIQVLRVGGKYALELIPDRALSPSQMRSALDVLKAHSPELKEKYGVEISEMRVEPQRISIVYKAGIMIEVALIVWAIIALLAIAGITITFWKLSEAVAAIPWEMALPVAALGFVAIIVYAISR